MTGVFPNPLVLLADWLLVLFATLDIREREHAGTLSTEDDHALMELVRQGDRDAFQQLFDKWKRPLISFFYRSTGDYHHAEDLALEVAVRVFQARDRYVPKARFSTWLFQIAHNLLRDSYRRSSAGSRREFTPEWEYPEAVDAANPLEHRLWEEWLTQALSLVPDNERTALLLVVQQGMTPAEAADILKIKPNHLRVLLNKARNRLKTFRKEES